MRRLSKSTTSLEVENNEWKMSLEPFISKRHGSSNEQRVPKNIRLYYKAQDELISTYEAIRISESNGVEVDEGHNQKHLLHLAVVISKVTFAVNFVLLIAKVVSVSLSGSVSIISSVVDSTMDLASGIVIWWTSRAIKKRNPYMYPQGRTKLEPVGIVILAVIMSASSAQIIKESVTRIIRISHHSFDLPQVDFTVIGLSMFTVVTKLVLYLVSRRIQTASVQALSQDHRNDLITNTAVIIFSYLGSKEMKSNTGTENFAYIDPIGAVIISIYIILSWGRTAYVQIRMLTGYRADPQFLSKITFMCVNHHPAILKVDTVRAFHFGLNFLVEVDIVLPEIMTLKEAHDIAEPLQQKIERLKEVERAFVHVDYEVDHNPNQEHKQV